MIAAPELHGSRPRMAGFSHGLKNRKNTKSGGDAVGANLRSASYSANLLNQYTHRTVPGFLNILGQARTNATVTLWSAESLSAVTPTYRKGEYFRGELAFANQPSAIYATITNLAVLNNGTNADIISTNIGRAFLPKTPEVFSDDADGNLTNDGRWTYTWDAENRLTSFTRPSTVPEAAKVKVDCQYDSRGRRTQKIVSGWNGSAYVAQSTNRFLYDGWNLVGIFDAQSSLLQSFTWGTDLSGTMQGAGGVGGLKSMTVHSGPLAGTYFYCYDGNGNVAALVAAADGSVAAQYEYGPFGEVIRATGPLAQANPFLFSTKFCDAETGFYYYGYRYYDPGTGRWLSRDPIEETGGMNVYTSVWNRPTSVVDLLGLDPIDEGVIVTIPAEPESGYDSTESSFVMDVNNRKKNHKEWIVIKVENIRDANKKLQSAQCKCIKELNVLGHGYSGRQNVVSIKDPQRTQRGYGRIWAEKDERTGKWNVTGLEMFKGLKPKFCKPCVVYLRGCTVGSGEAGRRLLKAVANATGCTAKAWSGTNTEATPYKGLPGSGFAGLFAGPDVSQEPD